MRVGLTLFAAICASVLLGAVGAQAATPRAEIRGVSDSDLRRRIEDAIGEARITPKNKLEARRLAEDSAETAALALRSEGYYDYVITPGVTNDTPPKGTLTIEPGPRVKLGQPQVAWVGPPPDDKASSKAIKALDLKAGDPGRAAEVVAAEGRVVAQLKQQGYADAKANPREVVVDHATELMTPTYRVDPGALVRLDGVQLVTKGRTRLKWVKHLQPWKTGQVYAPNRVAELERRLNDAGIYQSVEVSLAPQSSVGADGLRPVKVTLVDRAPISVQLGGSYSTAEGVGADSLVHFYNRLGMADTFTVILRAAQIEKLAGLQLSLPDVGAPDQTLELEPDFYYDQTNAFTTSGGRVRATLKKRLRKASYFTYGVTVDQMRDSEYASGPGPHGVVKVARSLSVVTGFVGVTMDRTDNILNPTHGWRVAADASPTLVTGDRGKAFAKLQAVASGYYPLGAKADTVLAARLKLGSIVSDTVPDLPAPLRFYSGGGGSVRGYTYQGIGPQFGNGAPEGGAAVFETSFEVRRHIVGPWGAAVFIDGGSLSRTPTPDFSHTAWAAGIGARYQLGFGPLRADIAFPFDHRGSASALQVYLGLGQAF